MARRSTPGRLYAAKRAATLERLVSAGELRHRAEERLRAYEAAQPAPIDWEAAYRALRLSQRRLRAGVTAE
jgi:hypothetical protein